MKWLSMAFSLTLYSIINFCVCISARVLINLQRIYWRFISWSSSMHKHYNETTKGVYLKYLFTFRCESYSCGPSGEKAFIHLHWVTKAVWLLTPNPWYLHSLLKNPLLSLQKIKILKRHILSFERQPRNIIKSNPQLWQIGNHCLLLPRLLSALFPYCHSNHETVIQQYTFFAIFTRH